MLNAYFEVFQELSATYLPIATHSDHIFLEPNQSEFLNIHFIFWHIWPFLAIMGFLDHFEPLSAILATFGVVLAIFLHNPERLRFPSTD